MTTVFRLALFTCLLSFLLIGCGEPRRYGDAGGRSVTFTVTVQKSFVSGMENRQGRPSAGVGVGFGSGGRSYSGVGVGLSFSSTSVYVAGADMLGGANVFRQEVKWGENTFTVPLQVGRTLYLTAIVEGGRRGWESLGSIEIPPAGDFSIHLGGEGPMITAEPPQTPTPDTTNP